MSQNRLSKRPPTTSLRKLPPEIRAMIFRMAMITESVEPTSPRLQIGCTAPLVVALRGDREVYKEALKVYWEMSSIYFDYRIFFTLQKALVPSCLASIRDLEVKIPRKTGQFVKSSLGQPNYERFLLNFIKDWGHCLNLATNVRVLSVLFHVTNVELAVRFIEKVLETSGKVEDLYVAMRFPLSMQHSWMSRHQDHIERLSSVAGKSYAEVSMGIATDKGEGRFGRIFWQADAGRVLGEVEAVGHRRRKKRQFLTPEVV